MKSFILLFSLLVFSTLGKADECTEWFSKLKLKGKPNCVSKCASALTDMSTFMCPNRCTSFCNVGDNNDEDFSLLKTYGLTDKEITYCEKNKLKCLIAYKLSWDTEKTCLEIFPRSGTNDESDACRRYIWSIFMAREIGIEDSEAILNAHEDNPKEPNSERAMDLANNRLGLLYFSKLKIQKPTNNEILDSFKQQLLQKKLIILKPKYKEKGGLP